MKKLILITATFILPQLALAEEAKNCSQYEKHVKYYSEKLESASNTEEQMRLEKELKAATERLEECSGTKKSFWSFG